MPTLRGKKNYRQIHAHDYALEYWSDFDFSILKYISARRKPNHKGTTYNDIIMMADTETSRKKDIYDEPNHICAWSLSLRAYNHNIATLWGQDPDDLTETIQRILDNMSGDETYLYWHNMPYDWCFIRKFMFKRFGLPESQLNVKPLYPLTIRFENGLIMRDSLMLAQRSLEKWAKDLDVEHQKAVGSWDYKKIRTQHDILSPEELKYIECDVLAGVECINATMDALNKNISSIPLTATGIPRGEARLIGKKNRAYYLFLAQTPEDYHLQIIYQAVFHGGYTHNNRYTCGKVLPALCMDFASSYPYCALAFKYPSEKFWKIKTKMSADYIRRNADRYCMIFKIKVTNLDLKDLHFPMPVLSHAKSELTLNAICDNGKVLRADYFECYMTEIDFLLFDQIYKYDEKTIQFEDVYASYKDYLPKWFTDYVYQCFINKTQLKGVDKVRYQIEKAKLNAVAYGMIAQQPCKPLIEEHYDTGLYEIPVDFDPFKEYEKHLKNHNNFLPYHWCMYVTSYAQFNLFTLGMTCVDYKNGAQWLYSDTDSVYATAFDMDKVKKYNEDCKKRLSDRGYGAVNFNGRDYWLGVAELDGEYSEFKGLHSKCYAVREKESGKLKITVAGVPKKGVETLKDDLKNFHTGTCFPGKISGKLQHKYFMVNDIYVDEKGNKTGDSIDLSECDYIIKDANIPDVEDITDECVEVQFYDDENEIAKLFSGVDIL